MGYRREDIIYGLCRSLVRNYLNNVGLGKEILPPIVFQGGVAFNKAIVKAFQEELDIEIIIPPHHEVMGAIGAALLVHEEIPISGTGSKFMGFGISKLSYHTSSFECQSCPNMCEIAQLWRDGKLLAQWGGRCDLWEKSPVSQ
jgi:hypothetical protein